MPRHPNSSAIQSVRLKPPVASHSANRLHTGRLVLTPLDAQCAVAAAKLQMTLEHNGLFGALMPGTSSAYRAGDRLLDLVGFTGCAVQLDLDASRDDAFVHVRIEGPHPKPVLRRGRNSRPPRCPTCNASLADWRDQTASWEHDEVPLLHCHACGLVGPAWAWNWRRQAGFGRIFVIIEEVFPGEGQPLPALLAMLNALGAGPWQHFYLLD